MSTAKVLVFVIYSILFYVLAMAAETDINWCNTTALCPNQGKHVRCNNTGDFSPNCTGFYELVNLDIYISLILHEHNMYRNYIAGGNNSCFYPACRMPLLTWDTLLAENAALNVKTCKFAHDLCRSTPAYKYAGQNIYWAYTSKMNMTWAEFFAEAVYLWFNEWKSANSSLMNNFRPTTPQTGHYTLMMTDRNSKVGCACLNNVPQPGIRQVIFTCDYTSTNILGFPCYQAGLAASCCKEKNYIYNNLCNDRIDPNDLYWYY